MESDRTMAQRIAIAMFLASSIAIPACSTQPDVARSEQGAIFVLKAIARGQQLVFARTNAYGSLQTADTVGAAGDKYKWHERNGYRFIARLGYREQSVEVHAVPVEYGVTGRRSFYMNESWEICAADHVGHEANATDPIVERAQVPDS